MKKKRPKQNNNPDGDPKRGVSKDQPPKAQRKVDPLENAGTTDRGIDPAGPSAKEYRELPALKKRETSFSFPLREALMIQISQIIEEKGWTQKQAAEFLGVTQPRISDLARARVENFTIDLLVDWLGVLGQQVSIEFKESENQVPFFNQMQFSATEDAISYYTKAITIDPLAPQSYLKRGDAYFAEGKYDLAVGDYARAMEFASDSSFLRLRRAIAYNHLGQYLAALHDCEIVLNKLVIPDDIENFSTLQGKDLIQEQYKNGRAVNSVTLDAELMSWGLLTKARALFHLERTGEAIECLLISTGMFPDFAAAHFELGCLFESMDQFQSAAKSFTQACNLDPTNVRYRERASELERKLHPNRAADSSAREIDLLNEEIETAQTIPQRAYGYRRRGQFYHQAGQYTLALADLLRAIELDPSNNDWVWSYIVYARFKSGDYNGTIRDCEKVIHSSDHSVEDLSGAYMYKGWALERLERDLDALNTYNEGISRNPGDPSLIWARGILLEKFGRLQEALDDYRNTIELAGSSVRQDPTGYTEQVQLYIDRLEKRM